MKHEHYARYKNVYLRPLNESDIENLRIWRNDKSKTKYLRKIGEITPQMQKIWFGNYLKNDNEITFAIVETEQLNRMVGSVSLYNFEANSAEFGRIQIGDSEANGKGLGRVSTAMVLKIGFKKLGLKKIVGSVHRDNIAAYKTDMRIGFLVTGSHIAPMGGIEDEIEIDEKRFLEINPYASEIIVD